MALRLFCPVPVWCTVSVSPEHAGQCRVGCFFTWPLPRIIWVVWNNRTVLLQRSQLDKTAVAALATNCYCSGRHCQPFAGLCGGGVQLAWFKCARPEISENWLPLTFTLLTCYTPAHRLSQFYPHLTFTLQDQYWWHPPPPPVFLPISDFPIFKRSHLRFSLTVSFIVPRYQRICSRQHGSPPRPLNWFRWNLVLGVCTNKRKCYGPNLILSHTGPENAANFMKPDSVW
jgi:hypothetical protein